MFPTARPPVIILGMHRSGTSLIAQLLDQLGLFQGRDLQDDHESTYFLQLNETIFRQVNACWDNPLPVRNLLAAPEPRRMTTLALRAELASRHIRAYGGNRRVFQLDQTWGWKDPRTVFTLPIWLSLFPTARIIYIVRHGVDVAASFMARELHRLQRRTQRFDAALARLTLRSPLDRAGYKGSARCLTLAGAFDLWVEYVRQADENLAGLSNPVHTLRYEDFLAAPADHLADLVRFSNLPPVTPVQIQAATAAVNPARSLAFSTDPALSAFHQQVKSNSWMVRHHYSSIV